MDSFQLTVLIAGGVLTILALSGKLWEVLEKLYNFLFCKPHDMIREELGKKCVDLNHQISMVSSRIEEVSSRQEVKILVMDAMIDGQLAILRDRLFQSCEHYIERGEITVAGLENINYLYKVYAKLDGNGTGDTLYEQASTLKIKVNKE